MTKEERQKYCEDHFKFKSSDFDIAEKYFDEAKSCYIEGYYKASIVMAVSALESAVKTDFINFLPDRKGEFGNKEQRTRFVIDIDSKMSNLNNLLSQYFSKDRFDRLPHHEEPIKDRIVQIRNSVVHTKDDEILLLSESQLEDYARRMLNDVKILIDHLDRLARSIGNCPKCSSELEIVMAKDAKHGNRYLKCTSFKCDYKRGLYPNEEPFLNNRGKVCICGRPIVKGITLKRGKTNSKEYERCLENCLLTPVRCKVCKSGMKIKSSKEYGIFFVCMNNKCNNTWS